MKKIIKLITLVLIVIVMTSAFSIKIFADTEEAQYKIDLIQCESMEEADGIMCVKNLISLFIGSEEGKLLKQEEKRRECDQLTNIPLKNVCIEVVDQIAQIERGKEIAKKEQERIQQMEEGPEKFGKIIFYVGIGILILLVISLFIRYWRQIITFLKGHSLSSILGIIGFAIPLLGFINEEWIRLALTINPLGPLLLFIVVGKSMVGEVILMSISGGIFYYLIGLAIEKTTKSKWGFIFAPLAIILFLGLSYLAYQMLVVSFDIPGAPLVLYATAKNIVNIIMFIAILVFIVYAIIYHLKRIFNKLAIILGLIGFMMALLPIISKNLVGPILWANPLAIALTNYLIGMKDIFTNLKYNLLLAIISALIYFVVGIFIAEIRDNKNLWALLGLILIASVSFLSFIFIVFSSPSY